MTVKDLIRRLSNIADQNKEVVIWDYDIQAWAPIDLIVTDEMVQVFENHDIEPPESGIDYSREYIDDEPDLCSDEYNLDDYSR